MSSRRMLAGATVVVALVTLASAAEAQILDRMKRRVERKVDQRVDRAADKAVDKALDTAEDAVKCVATDRACVEQAEKAGKPVVLTDAAGKPVAGGSAAAGTAGAAARSSAGRPGEGAWVNYDFVPGERPLFVEDFSTARVGDFPRRLEHEKGNAEVAEWNGTRWLRGTSWPTVVVIPLAETLPERFTLEMDVVPGIVNTHLEVHFAEEARDHVRVRSFNDRAQGGLARGTSSLAESQSTEEVPRGTPFPLRVMADGKYVKVYAGATRLANVPSAELGRSRRIVVEIPGNADHPGFVANVRVMAGGRALYDALAADGRVATQGVYFDTGSDRIRPESNGVLREIAEMLGAHASLALTIEGHTDDTGDAAANQRLSEQRAAAVKAALVATYGVSGDRLKTAGFGASKPAVPNASPEARQQNRRVELVKN